MVTSLETLSGLAGISFASGVNLYAAVLVVGLGIRYNLLPGLPAELAPLAHGAVLITAAILYIIEFVADKIPVVSVVWDAIHTFVRPIGAVVMSFAATSEMGGLEQTLAGLAGGAVALTSHGTKMGVRLLTHGTGEPVTQAGLSIVEDVFAVGLVLLVAKHPYIAAAVTLGLLGVAIVVLRLAWKLIFKIVGTGIQKVKSWFSPQPEPNVS